MSRNITGEVSKLFLYGEILFDLVALKSVCLIPTKFLQVVSIWSKFST